MFTKVSLLKNNLKNLPSEQKKLAVEMVHDLKKISSEINTCKKQSLLYCKFL